MEKVQQILARTLFLYWVSKPQDPADLDLKKLMREKTERFAVFACGVLTLIFSIIGINMAANAGDGEKKAKDLAMQTAALKSQLANAKPSPNDVPSDTDRNRQEKGFEEHKVDSSDRYRGNALWATAAPLDDRRSQPRILQPSEGKAGVVMAQVRTYIFFKDDTEVMVLEDSNVKGIDKGIQQLGERTAASKGGPKTAGPTGSADPRLSGPQATGVEATKKAFKTRQVPLNKLGNTENVRLAVQTRPLRMAIVVASFPYEEQIKEFRRAVYGNKIQMRDVLEDTIEEEVEEPNEDGTGMVKRRKYTPAFRFREVEMQRRVVDSTGWPVDPKTGAPLANKDDGWGAGSDEKDKDREVLDLRTKYRRWLFLAGSVTQLEKEENAAALFPGLYMPLLQQMREGQYPELENELRTLKSAIAEYNKDPKADIISRPKQFDTDNFDPFGGKTVAIGTDPRNDPRSRPPTIDPRNPGQNRQEIKPIKHVLIRLIDVDIDPGKIYEYRVRVRMSNPNYGKKDVANPKFADPLVLSDGSKTAELQPGEWYVVPDKVVVPPELEIYAVDQGSIDKTPNLPVTPRDATVMQIHKWIELFRPEGKIHQVGEWSVAERVVVHRGEAIDRVHKVEVPVWEYAREMFVLLGAVEAEPGKRPPKAGVDVPFGNLSRPSVLANFEGGAADPYSYTRKGEKALTETARTEVLVMSPDGKLMAHNGAVDGVDKVRTERLGTWKARLDEVRKGTKPSNKGPNDPLDK
jgi:hypothetical protein